MLQLLNEQFKHIYLCCERWMLAEAQRASNVPTHNILDQLLSPKTWQEQQYYTNKSEYLPGGDNKMGLNTTLRNQWIWIWMYYYICSACKIPTAVLLYSHSPHQSGYK